MKAIIPVAGLGTRLKPLTDTIPKVLLNVAGKPMLGHLLDKLIEIGVEEVIFVTGYLGEKIKEYVNKEYSKIRAVFVEQKETKGVAHAIWLAEKYVNEPVLIIFGDTLFDGSLEVVLQNKKDGLIGVCPTDNPKRFGIIETKGEIITNMVEKPENPPSNLAIIGIYYIQNYKLLFECINHIIFNDIKTKGEYQLTDALQLMINQGAIFGFFQIKEWLDCGTAETLLETNRKILDKIAAKNSKEIGNSTIIQPSLIGKNVIVENSVIGPYTVIADNCIVKNSKIADSIIDYCSKIEDCEIKKFILGNNSEFKGDNRSKNFIEVE